MYVSLSNQVHSSVSVAPVLCLWCSCSCVNNFMIPRHLAGPSRPTAFSKPKNQMHFLFSQEGVMFVVGLDELKNGPRTKTNTCI